MTTKLDLKPKNEKLYLPEEAEILEIKDFTPRERFFRLAIKSGRSLGHVAGQFIETSLLGFGEAPISISSPPSKDNKFDLCIRAVGDVTNKLHTLKVGDTIFFRGPFGHGFDDTIIHSLLGKHLLFITGGLGYVPLRSLINQLVPERKKYKQLTILNGCRTPQERMYPEELQALAKMGGNVVLKETVDKSDGKWEGNVGVITTLIPQVDFNPQETIAIICGPPIMYKFVLKSLLAKNLPEKNIYLSLERRMKCGVGKCGHCQMEGVYVCQSGPVFNYAEIVNNREAF